MKKTFTERLGAEGVYFVVRLSDSWKIVSDLAQERDGPAHIDLWETQLARRVAREWAPVLKSTESALLRRLDNCPYAFPRGRVVKHAGKFVVYHGEDLEAFMKISKQMIETEFGIVGKARWQLDEHERCQREDKEIVREVLGLRENWKDAG